MIVEENVIEKYYIKKDGMTFTPKTKIIEKKIGEKTVICYDIIETAEEVYQEWLKNKDKKIEKKPSSQDILNAKLIADNAELLKANEEQKKLNADLLFKIAILGGKANV